ncbi:MAG: choice-of-anchor D domain-containing protein, partial [Candidatus Kapaibacterium sp.]
NVVTCVGSPTSYQVTVTNVNRVDVEITGSNIYATESQVQQGSPRYPILRNAFGERVQSLDYFLTENPGVAPYTANSFLQYPLVVKPGETKTFYVNYMPTRKGIRYGRLFLRTNGENFTGTEIGSFDREGEGIEEVEGLLTVDLFGKSVGGTIAGVSGTKLPEPLVFETLDPNTSSLKSAVIRNSGDCDLRINSTKLRIGAGDVQDFEIVSALANTSIDPATRDFILPPGGVDSIVVKFSPVRSGSRRATIELKTNDSALYIEGVAERGSYYLDLYGVGASGLDVASSITLPPAVIDGPGSTGTVKLENSSVEPITINSIVITGGSTEIVEDPSSLWPSFPVTIGAADELELEVAFDPTSGSAPGSRTATMQVVLSDGRIVDIVLNGTAGTRLIATPRPTLFGSSEVAVGEIKREVAVITNNGTFPLEIQDMMIVGGGASDYRVNPLPRAIIAPGGSEFVEITYSPQAQGNSLATLTITSNATNGTPAGTLEIALGGTAVPATSGGVVDPSGSTTGLPGEGATTIASRGSASENNATSSVNSSAQGIVNLQNMPNPAQVETTIVFTLGTSSEAIINLYNAEGQLVKTLLNRELGAGTHEVVCDLSDLPSGQYFYQLTANGTVAGRGLQVTK